MLLDAKQHTPSTSRVVRSRSPAEAFPIYLVTIITPCEHTASKSREIKATPVTRGHYGAYDLYGVILFEENKNTVSSVDSVIEQKNVTVFADGQIDRSPCGSGTAARLAILLAEGRLGAGQGKLLHQSLTHCLRHTSRRRWCPVERIPSLYTTSQRDRESGGTNEVLHRLNGPNLPRICSKMTGARVKSGG